MRFTSPGRYRALTTLLLLSPATPMLFMGQEFAASSPFLYFADQERQIAHLVREGRWEFLRNFSRIAGIANPKWLADPADPTTFLKSKLNWDECDRNSDTIALHRDLMRMRREDPTFARQDGANLYGAVIGPEAFLLRWLYNTADDRLILVNLGRDLNWSPAAEPLLAPPPQTTWLTSWSSEEPEYGGAGTRAADSKDLVIPGNSATVLVPISTEKNAGQQDDR